MFQLRPYVSLLFEACLGTHLGIVLAKDLSSTRKVIIVSAIILIW
jgi:hypothetical protein